MVTGLFSSLFGGFQFTVFGPFAARLLLTVRSVWQSKSAHLMVGTKERGRGGDWGLSKPFKGGLCALEWKTI
jgi:hypothetical protein